MEKVIFFTGNNCQPCEQLKKGLLDVGVTPAQLEAVTYPVMDNLNLAGKYGIRTAPTVIVVDSEGNVRVKYTGVNSQNIKEIAQHIKKSK